MKLNEAIQSYLAEAGQTAVVTTIDSYGLRLGQFKEFLGSRQPTKQVVTQWFNSLRPTLSTRTILCYRQTLSTFFNYCVTNGLCRVNPVIKLKLSPATPDRPVFTVEEYHAVRSLAIAEQSYWAPAIVLGWHTGLRLSDVALMKWQQIDFTSESIKVTPHKTKRFAKSVEIPMGTEVFQCLAEVRLAGADLEYVSREMATHYQFDQHKTLSMQFIRLARKAGVDKSYHSFRHAAVSRWLANGATPAQVSLITGQNVLQVMTYAHSSLADKRKVMGI